MLSVQQELIQRQEEVIRNLREILQKTGCWNMLNDQSLFTTEVDNHLNGGGNGEGNGDWTEDENDKSETEYEDVEENQVRDTQKGRTVKQAIVSEFIIWHN
jgi:hypothetical protein